MEKTETNFKIVICEECKGFGEVFILDKNNNKEFALCKECNGTGKIKITTIITIKVEAFDGTN